MTQKGMIDGGKMSNGIGVFTSWQSGKPPVPRISQERADGTRKKERERANERAMRGEVEVVTRDAEGANGRIGACSTRQRTDLCFG